MHAKTTRFLVALLCCTGSVGAHAATKKAAAKPEPRLGAGELIAQSKPQDWRGLDPSNTLLMQLDGGQVIIELAPRFAPKHSANIRTLAKERYFDGLAILRVQDNFVTQWGDPDAENTERAKPLGTAAKHVPAEFDVALKGLPLTRLPDVDGWAPVTGFVDGMPVAADPNKGRAWLAHCYGMVGAGRNNPPDSSTGAELYVVIGQAPRGLDLNITLVGRVLKGMELLSGLPRGGPNMGFYDKPEQRTAIRSTQLLADLPEGERPALQVLRTDTRLWQQLLAARRDRREEWFVHNPGHINLCNATVPVRSQPAP